MFLPLQLGQAPALYDPGIGPTVIALSSPWTWRMDFYALSLQASFSHDDHTSVASLLPDSDYSNNITYSNVNNKDIDTLTIVPNDIDSVSTDDGSTGNNSEDISGLILSLPPLSEIISFSDTTDASPYQPCSFHQPHESGDTAELKKMVTLGVLWPFSDRFFFT